MGPDSPGTAAAPGRIRDQQPKNAINDANPQPNLSIQRLRDKPLHLIPITNEIGTFPRVEPDLRAGRWESQFLSGPPGGRALPALLRQSQNHTRRWY